MMGGFRKICRTFWQIWALLIFSLQRRQRTRFCQRQKLLTIGCNSRMEAFLHKMSAHLHLPAWTYTLGLTLRGPKTENLTNPSRALKLEKTRNSFSFTDVLTCPRVPWFIFDSDGIVARNGPILGYCTNWQCKFFSPEIAPITENNMVYNKFELQLEICKLSLSKIPNKNFV